MSRRNKKTKKTYKVISFVLLILTVVLYSLLIFFNAFPNRLLIPGLIIFGILIFIIMYKLNTKTKLLSKILLTILSFIIMIGELIGIFSLFGTFDFINDIFDKGHITNEYGLYVLKDSNYKKITNLKNKNIIIYNDDNTLKIEEQINKKYNLNLTSTKSQEEAFKKITENKADAIIIQNSIIELLPEEELVKYKLIFTFEIKRTKDTKFKEVNIEKNPFTVYLSGVDTTGSINKTSRSDVNLLAFVNPQKGKILIVNTPRDYYVNLIGKNSKDKLTHVGIYGIEQSALSLKDLYKTDINYYAKVNFTSFVNIINTLNGIEVNVEKPDYRYNQGIDCTPDYICEQNSNREFGNKLIYVKSGKQVLNGEQALAYARNRYQYNGGDNQRGKHQEQIVEALIKKLTASNILTKYNSLLKGISEGVKTNINQKTISKFINMQIDKNIKWEIESVVLKGVDSYDYTYSTGKYKCYVMKTDEESLNLILEQIKNIMI